MDLWQARRIFRFSSTFNLEAPRKQVHDVLVDLERYVEWWPQVRAVAKLDDDNAVVVCRSTLPYDLELQLTAVIRSHDLLEVAIDGPIRGRATYRLEAVPTRTGGPGATHLRYQQEVRAEAPLFAVASYVAKPLLVWNHQQMMVGAERGLRARLEPGPGQPSDASAAS